MTHHGWDVWTFPSMPLVHDLSSKGRGVSLCKYLHSHHAELHCLFATSHANLKKRVSLLHTSLNRQFDVHYCLEPLQFSHGYQRKEQLMAIFSLTLRLRCFWAIKGSRIRSACVQEGRNHIQFHFEHIHLRLVIFFPTFSHLSVQPKLQL